MKTQNKSALSSQIYLEQEKLQIPGLSSEAIEIAKILDIVDEYMDEDIKLKTFKNLSKKKIKNENENQLRKGIMKYKKMIDKKDEKFEIKDYLKTMNLNKIRTQFKYRMKILKIKFNFKNTPAY